MGNFWDRINRMTGGSYTRKQLASDCDIAPNTISSWISRKSYPSADVAVKVAHALNTTVEFLVTGEQRDSDFVMNQVNTVPYLKEIVDNAHLYSEEQMEQLAVMARFFQAKLVEKEENSKK